MTQNVHDSTFEDVGRKRLERRPDGPTLSDDAPFSGSQPSGHKRKDEREGKLERRSAFSFVGTPTHYRKLECLMGKNVSDLF